LTDKNAFISTDLTVKGEHMLIAHYSKQELEERAICSACSLQYTIYGAFWILPGPWHSRLSADRMHEFRPIVETAGSVRQRTSGRGSKLVEIRSNM